MRFPRLTVVLVAAATSLALAPAGALARVHHGVRPAHPAGGCHVRLTLSPRVITSGEPVLLTGALICRAASVASQPVTIYQHIDGIGGFNPVGSATTAADGSFTFTPTAVVADSGFYALGDGARSGTRVVRVGPQVTAIPPAPEGATFLTGRANRITFSGTVSPEDRGAEVVLQREGNATEEWGPIQRGVFVQPDGTFLFVHRFLAPGDANLRIIVRPKGHFGVRGISDVMSYTISQAQNPNLTLEPSPRPVTFGQPLKLSGVTKAGPGAKVVVSGRTFGGTPVPVGEVTAGAGGAYELTIPAAVQNTHYFARSGPFHSANVWVGVKWVLTPNAIPASVPSGTQVMFTGTAAPTTRTGHPVYLERHNASGNAWHIVSLGFTGAGGAYSIPWYVIGSGKEAYRVKVPGDKINVATASAAQEIEVTPALPSTPTPVVQPTLPH
ncbi:MAG TPA: hypothetical protein VFW29_00975 [Solirubrobacteraceae bacterium]|nr:hypothetical protein [Solirubrobacteraceae bacterium]